MQTPTRTHRRPVQENTSGGYEGMTMTEPGDLIEKYKGQKKLTAEDLEEMKWGPDDKGKGWGI